MGGKELVEKQARGQPELLLLLQGALESQSLVLSCPGSTDPKQLSTGTKSTPLPAGSPPRQQALTRCLFQFKKGHKSQVVKLQEGSNSWGGGTEQEETFLTLQAGQNQIRLPHNTHPQSHTHCSKKEP